MAKEKRIYVVVAETVQTEAGSIIQPCGRIAAQCAHVVSRMQVHRARWDNGANLNQGGLIPVTTVVLAARDSRELDHVMRLLLKSGTRYTEFQDHNPPVYGTEAHVVTALCTYPVYAGDMFCILDYLPLWHHGRAA